MGGRERSEHHSGRKQGQPIFPDETLYIGDNSQAITLENKLKQCVHRLTRAERSINLDTFVSLGGNRHSH